MLFKRAVLEGIAAGAVTLAFRRWRRPSVKVGGRLRTAAGVLAIEAVDPIMVEAITEADAHRAGFASRSALLADMAITTNDETLPVYRVELRLAGPDPRIALRAEDALDDTAMAVLDRALARLDRMSRGGHWTGPTLAAIDANPGVRAAVLAQRLGRAMADLKGGIRKLKELGLTESLATGYRLAPRGRAYLHGSGSGGRGI